MLFNSFEFCFVFFPLVTALYFLLPYRWRWLLLLVASCWFYMAFVPVYILILAFTIGVDYVAGLLIERSQGRRRRAWLTASIIANVGVLAVFKYYGFLTGNIEALLHALGWTNYAVPDLGLLLPIGLSFHTFQSLSYTIEVYRGKQEAEKRIGYFALYVMFYPQLVAGPIERPANLLRQLHLQFDPDYDRIVHGLKQMLWGFFKKLVIADRCAQIVDLVYDDPSKYNGWSALLATYCFAVQIYCDFSGYTDIALGAARVMGFDLMVNFRTPYRSRSISEFWGRWHISLSSWFRDYLYIPLGGNRVAKGRWFLNLMIVFLVSGLWHGANWTYVAWGGLHGLYLVLALVFAGLWARFDAVTGLDRRPRIRRAINVFITFHLVLLAWVFFRARTIHEAWGILGKWIGNASGDTGVTELIAELKAPWMLVTIGFAMLFLVIDPVVDAWIKRERALPARPFDFAFQALLLTACLLFGFFGKTMFIYFQFYIDHLEQRAANNDQRTATIEQRTTMARRFLLSASILVAVFLAVYVLLFWTLCQVHLGGTPLIYRCVDALNWKGGNSYQKFREFDPGDRYDVVFIGSSHAYRGYDPGLFEQRGYHAFNLGTSGQSPLNSYFILTNYLTPANTRLVLLDTYESALENDGLESTADLTQNISKDGAAIDMVLALRDPRGLNMLMLRWMRRDAPQMFTDSTYLPGGASLNTDSVRTKIQYVTGKPLKMEARQQHYLHRFLEHCAGQHIPVVLVSHPYPQQADRAKHAEFMTWLRAEVAPFGFPVYDFAFDHGLPLDDEDHFYDHNHLNRAGVEIFDHFLIDRLERDGVLKK